MMYAAYLVAVLIEVGGGLALLLGWQARAAGVTLAIFAVATAVVFHTHFTDPVMVIPPGPTFLRTNRPRSAMRYEPASPCTPSPEPTRLAAARGPALCCRAAS